ncbi:hypothetical protein IAI18_17535 [Acetobacteraceae bacterium H6797]|nr:hypothetical protein [Acetobacteraceae bacterium H6797]
MRQAMMAAAACAALLATPSMAQTGGANAGQPSQAGPVTEVQTVADLAAVCAPSMSNPLRLESIAYCQGFLNAAGQYHAAMTSGQLTRPLFCVSNPAPTVAQSGIAFAAWAEQNKQYANEPALDGLIRWAQVTYPCPAEPAATAPASRTHRQGAR